MLNYIHADIKRIISKKSFLIFILINIVLFEAIVFITSHGQFDAIAYVNVISLVVAMMPIIIGIYIFSVVYMDDLRSKSIQSAIGFGFKRSEIILVKFINNIILTLITLVLMYAVIVLTGFGYKLDLNAKMLMMMFKMLLSGGLNILLYSSIASLVVYGLQKTAMSMTVFILLITNTVYLILSLILEHDTVVNLIGNQTKFLPSMLLTSFSNGIISNHIESYVIIAIVFYLVFSFIFATLLFRHKELEF